MSDGFADLITRANGFFTDLSANNNREFYEAHKATYNADIKKPAELLADLFAEDLAKATGTAHKPKLFRIHRDVRFSKDKTPYNTHLHLLWSQPVQAPTPAWFFGSAPDYLLLGMGVMNLEKDSLTAYRTMVDRHGDELTDAMDAAHKAIGARLSDWGPDPLKRVPKTLRPRPSPWRSAQKQGLCRDGGPAPGLGKGGAAQDAQRNGPGVSPDPRDSLGRLSRLTRSPKRFESRARGKGSLTLSPASSESRPKGPISQTAGYPYLG
ncbi:DUF2461 domain-containing protein [Hasllibacter sp. MH4015]|uniref:DUF2461 domain-containing protein n=1 Tax=Hasllibacter sp. MH4015 TaxID=2854029 RepID=UPI001CD21E1A|nr:DUF2461 domain-containing protein [Hasllibacter sp. MH4015]